MQRFNISYLWEFGNHNCMVTSFTRRSWFHLFHVGLQMAITVYFSRQIIMRYIGDRIFVSLLLILRLSLFPLLILRVEKLLLQEDNTSSILYIAYIVNCFQLSKNLIFFPSGLNFLKWLRFICSHFVFTLNEYHVSYGK